MIKNENETAKNDEIDDIIEQADDDGFDYDPTMEDDEKNDNFNNTSQEYKDIYQIVDTDGATNINSLDGVIKNPERNTFALRVYECFFCRMVSVKKNSCKSILTDYAFRDLPVKKPTKHTTVPTKKSNARLKAVVNRSINSVAITHTS